MLEEFKKELRALFESEVPFSINDAVPSANPSPTPASPVAVIPPAPEPTSPVMQEDDEKSSDFLYTSPNGDNYKVVVEPDEEELNVFDKDGKKIDIFTPDMLEINGGLPSETRKALFNYWKTEANKTVEEPAP